MVWRKEGDGGVKEEREREKQNTALKRKKNGSPDSGALGVNEAAEGAESVSRKKHWKVPVCRWHETRRAS